MEDAPRDLSTEVDLHIVNDEEEILHGGRITAVEFKDAGENPETGLAVVTVQK